MASLKSSRTGLGLALLAVGNLIGAGAQAQTSFPSGAATPFREDPASALSRHLKALSDSPRSVGALMGAGKAALELGDAQAAVTFFARAEEIEPRNGRIKAGIGSALLMMEQPHSALKFFADAAALGAPEVEIARDRGLAYDLTGDPRRAQKDYALVLARTSDPEVQRRMALSRAIAGDKAGALQAIDDQLRRQDRAAWRTRAFVLALTGDSAGAAEAVNSAMPGAATQMQPFLAKLPGLKPAERAMAVHFGHFPGDPRSIQMADASAATTSYSAPQVVTDAGRPDNRQTSLGRRNPVPEPVSKAPRRRPGSEDLVGTRIPRVNTQRQDRKALTERAESLTRTPARDTRIASASPKVAPPANGAPTTAPASTGTSGTAVPTTTSAITAPIVAAPAPSTSAPVTESQVSTTSTASTSPPASTTTMVPTPAPTTVAASPAPAQAATNPPISIATSLPIASAPISTANTTTASPPPASSETAVSTTAPAPSSGSAVTSTSLPASQPATPETTAPASSLADIAAAISKLSDEPATSAATPTQLAQNDAKPAPAAKPEPKREEPKPAPAKAVQARRHWVQIASAPDSLVTSEYRRLKKKHSKLLSDKDGYRTAMGKSNRVLVGPFASAAEASGFVGKLKGESLTAVPWTSLEGQEIEKLPGQ